MVQLEAYVLTMMDAILIIDTILPLLLYSRCILTGGGARCSGVARSLRVSVPHPPS
jgi:hypothetical protein